jgi:hypothetical protein
MENNNKFIKINGCYVSIYRIYRTQPVLLHRRVVEPAFIQLYYKLSELDFDMDLYNELSDENKDYLSFVFHSIHPHLENKRLEIETAKKSRKLQERLVLLEGMIMSGNINIELVNELNEILDKLIKSSQIPAKQGARMKNRVKRTYEAMKKNIDV